MNNRQEEKCRIYLTDQLEGRPNIKTMSREIMLAITNFYNSPKRAEGYRKKIFTDWHKPAWDSGGFQFLMGKLSNPDPMRTVEIYKKVGVKPCDLPIQLDLPPRYDLPKEERLALIYKSAEFYWRMVEHIPYVIGVVHGWTRQELSTHLELLDDPDRMASGSNLAFAMRNKVGKFTLGSGAFLQSGRYVLDEAGNLKKPMGSGSFLNMGGYANDFVVGSRKPLGAGTNLSLNKEHILSNVTSDKDCISAGTYHASHIVGVGIFSPMLYPWSMGNLNPHSDVRDRIASAAFLQSGQWVADSLANTPSRKARKSNKVVATPLPSQADLGHKNTILTNGAMVRKKSNTPSGAVKKEEKKTRVPLDVIINRLATVLNMLRDRELFMLGGASPHMQHMIFLGGARYSDTSAWRLKSYFGEVYLPEIGARSIGYTETSKWLKESEKSILRECLRDSTHPFEGMPVDRFLRIGHMNITEWRETWPENQWEVKPFPLRALHNAWVLKMREEVIANEYANDPDRYYKYLLNKRFKGRSQLTKRLEMLWSRLEKPWVQTEMGVFLKGGDKGLGVPKS